MPSLVNGLLGPVRRRKHVLFVLASLQLYVVSVGVAWHTCSLGLLSTPHTLILISLNVLQFVVLFGLVRSGWSHRFADPTLSFAHALSSIALSVLAFIFLGDLRANVLILIGQALVLSMLRVRPSQVLQLGWFAVVLLAMASVGLSMSDGKAYPVTTSVTIFAVGAPALLILSVLAKWVSDIRGHLSAQARSLSEAVEAVERMATTDMLTGLNNRRVMIDVVEAELRLSERTGLPFSVALIDLDHFKQLNDRFGHQAGDTALRQFSRQAETQLREVDRMGRWGGEEFLVLLPQLAQGEALVAMERLRRSIRNMRFEEHALMQVTISVGIAQARAGDTIAELIDRADQAVYAAKHGGRNRCTLAPRAQHDVRPSATERPAT